MTNNNTALIAHLAGQIEKVNKAITSHTLKLASGALDAAEEKATYDARLIAVGMLTAYNQIQQELIAQDQGH